MPVNLNPNVGEVESDTGLAPLPDVGTLSYNGIEFSALFKTETSGKAVKDAAGRTTRYTEWVITVEGFVTLDLETTTTDATLEDLRDKLSQQGGRLTYQGKGLGQDLDINAPGQISDVAWGPVPEVLEFKPLGASRAALIKWRVTTRIFDSSQTKSSDLVVLVAGGAPGPVLQFNEETSVGYDADGYSSLSIRGTLEIPLTRTGVPPDKNRTVSTTADAWRQAFMNQVVNSVDLTRFKVTRRDFSLSRDKRTQEWAFAAEELAPMPLPVGCTSARGEFTVGPAQQGAGLIKWLCNLSATYTVRKDQPRRLAWAAFVTLLAFRMRQSALGSSAAIAQAGINAQQPGPPNAAGAPIPPAPLNPQQRQALLDYWQKQLALAQQGQPRAALTNAWLINFRVREGLYEDSRTTSFEATWTLITVFDLILPASGLWRGAGIGLNGVPGEEHRLWAKSVQSIMGGNSWLVNQFDPAQDVILDLGF